MAAKKTKGPAFLRFVLPILKTLRDRGGSGTASEVTDWVIEECEVHEAEQEETTSNGQSRVRNQIAWARFYLKKALGLRPVQTFEVDTAFFEDFRK